MRRKNDAGIAEQGLTNMAILYIEDNPHNMRLVRKLLQSMGFNMIEAMDGLRGLHMAAEHRPDLILVDINLPDIDGLEVVRRLKSDPTLAHIPAVALTANAMYGDRENCLAGGCDGYLAKPIARMELKNVLSHFLGEATV
jgi:two-component system, cell cycle response regulator DivK